MKNQLLNFDNLDLDCHIRVVEQNNQILFIAKDVCDALDIKNSRDALSRLEDDEKGVAITDTPGGKQKMVCVTESGLYALVFRSQKEKAIAFRKWVTSEVLPAIRQHGKYDPAEVAMLMAPRVRQAYFIAEAEEHERKMIQFRKQADLACAIVGQMTVYQWLLWQGEDPKKSGTCGSLSGKCKRLADERGIEIGSVRVIDHCGQTIRLSRFANTYPEDILREVCGEAVA